MNHQLRYEVNCSILFTELPLLERPEAVKAAGFDAVEFWWPFAEAVPSDKDVDAFVAAVQDAGVHLVGLGERLGCTAFNALFGNRVDGIAAEAQDELGAENLALAARAAARIGGTVLVEPVSGADRYPLLTAADAIAAIDRAGEANIGLLADLYHLAVNGDDVDAVIAAYAARIAHVQIADAPGRNEPGTGELPLEPQLAALEAAGYAGWVGLEYKPATTSAESFDWLPRERRGAATATH
jgi:hydroxypyruvate isomerase